jgi:hypothetical protein
VRHRRSPTTHRSTAPAPRPGPDILYADPVVAPQLTNAGVWRAHPVLVSGARSYRDGEFVYQDYLYDDHGARLVRDPSDPRTDTLALKLRNVGTVTVHPERARITCGAALTVDTDGPVRVVFAGCGRAEAFSGAGTFKRSRGAACAGSSGPKRFAAGGAAAACG